MQFFISSSVQQLWSAKCIKLTGNKDWNSFLASFDVKAKNQKIKMSLYFAYFPILAMSFVFLATKLARFISYPRSIYNGKR